MGHPDIKDYINSLDDNQENNDHQVDEKETQLLMGVLSNPEQKEQLQEALLQKGSFEKIMKLITNGINSQNTIESLDYYAQFISSFESVQNFHDDEIKLIELAKQKIQDQKNTINKKNDELAKKKDAIPVENIKKIEDTKNTIINNELSNKLNLLSEKDLSDFKGVIDDLKNGLLTPDKVLQFASMMNVLRSMNGLSKDQIMSVVNTTIDTKFVDKKNSPEMKGFKEILSAVLDKGLVGKFIDQVDEDLNKNEKLQGASYDILLDKNTDLKSAESRAGILHIFNADENGFNRLIEDFDNSDKKAQVENIVKEYVKSGFPDKDLSNITVAVGEMTLESGEKKKCFTMKNGNDIVEVPSGKKDANGNDIMKTLTPFFGDAKYGQRLSVDQYMNPDLMKDILGKDNLKMEGVANVMKELLVVNGKKLSFAEAISSLFESPLFLEIKQAFLALLSMLGDDADKQTKYAIEANFAQAERDISKIKETIKDKNGNQISYLKALKALNLENKDMGEEIGNPKERFANAPLSNQKDYIKEVTADPNLRYNKDILDKLGKKVSQPEIVASDKDKENKNAVVLVEGKETTIGEHKVIKQGDYYLIDGKPSDGTIFIKDADGKLTKKTLKVDNTDFESQDVMLTPNESITTLYPTNSQALAQGKEDIFRYYALESSGDVKNPNPIDELLKLEKKPEGIDKIISTMKKKLTGLDSTKRTKLEIQKIFQEGLNELQGIDMGDNKTQYNTALNKRATAVGIETSNIATVTPKPSDASKKTA